MLDRIATFRSDEDGAVTVDWVVLTAAIVGLGVAVVVATRNSTLLMGQQIGASLSQTTSSILSYDSQTGAATPVNQ